VVDDCVAALQNTTPSPVQLEIFQVVREIYPTAALEQPACDGQLFVDIALHFAKADSNGTKQDTMKVAIECDGQHHFFINTHHHELTPKTKLRNAMLIRDGWQVVLLDTYAWYSTTFHPDRGRRKEVRRKFIIELLKKNGLDASLNDEETSRNE
jgi:hypothetical protein